jgi:hypothetical protein
MWHLPLAVVEETPWDDLLVMVQAVTEMNEAAEKGR